MDKVKKWVVDLAVPMLKAYINYGHGLEEDGVSVTAKGIEFLAEFEPGLYPMYAIELREYVEHMGIAIEDVQEIHLVAAAYDENEEEIDFSIEYEKCALVSEDELNGYSNSDILPTTNYKVIGSKEITKIKLTANRQLLMARLNSSFSIDGFLSDFYYSKAIYLVVSFGGYTSIRA